jgi:hypothetical protein
MTIKVLYTPKGCVSNCDLPYVLDYANGTIIQCQECNRVYIAKVSSTGPGTIGAWVSVPDPLPMPK